MKVVVVDLAVQVDGGDGAGLEPPAEAVADVAAQPPSSAAVLAPDLRVVAETEGHARAAAGREARKLTESVEICRVLSVVGRCPSLRPQASRRRSARMVTWPPLPKALAKSRDSHTAGLT
jgi:hypothetical protein